MAEEKQGYIGALGGNAIKLIACALMLADHIGMILLPDVVALRMIGRLAMPLFSFMFAEGCFYTRHKLRHFLTLLCMGVCTSAAMSVTDGAPCGDILISFALACPVIYSIDTLKKSVFARDGRNSALLSAALALSLALAVYVCLFSPVRVDYGLSGVLLPVTVRLLDFRSYGFTGAFSELYCHALAVVCFALGLIAVSFESGGIQFYCLLSLPVLALYSGRRGDLPLKYFFYIFYPAHLALLFLIRIAIF